MSSIGLVSCMVRLLSGIMFLHDATAMIVGIQDSEVWSPAEVTSIQRRSPESSTLNIQVTTFGETHNLELIRAPSVFAPNFQQYVATEDQEGNVIIQEVPTGVTEQEAIESTLYTNADGSTSLSVKQRNGQMILEGILDHDIHIKEDTSEERSDGRVQHMATRIAKPDGECRTLEPNGTTFQEPPIQEMILETRQAIPSIVQPEVFLVIEYNFSLKFGHSIARIKQYLSVFFNSANRRYDSVPTPKIRNVISRILLITSSTAERAFKVVGSGIILDAGKTLEAFGRWLYNQRGTINDYDVALWLTSQELGSKSGSSYTSGILGIAYVGGACLTSGNKFIKVGLSKDIPNTYSGIHTATHELAHLYGAAHDGERVNFPPGNPGATSCPWSGGYIMSYLFGSPNKMYFSKCAGPQFKHTIGSSYGACLRSGPRPNQVPPSSTYPGTLVSLDQQCKNEHGSQYYFYQPNINKVCVERWCARSGSSQILTGGPALEGSPCDRANKKWCIKGVCVSK